MFRTLRNMFKVEEIRKGLIFTFLMLIVIRLGSQLPTPGVDSQKLSHLINNLDASGGFNLFNAMTGGSFERMSVFALSITPYITSSIIMQLMTIAIPKLEELQRDGEEGRKKIVEITRYLTVGLSLAESLAMAIGFGRSGYLTEFNVLSVLVITATLTAGSAFLMWIGEQITTYGVGNGISIVLVINILSRVPNDMVSLFQQFVAGKKIAPALLAAIIIIAVILITITLVIVLQDAERRIPVQYSKKTVGRRQYGGQSTHIPLKVNTAGVIPVIFASSLLQFPIVIASMFGKGNGTGIGSQILKAMNANNWINPSQPVYSIGFVVYILLIVFFAYFYTSITFNPIEVADNMKKQGGFIPGIRPGRPTTDYLNNILHYIIFIGAVGLVIVCSIPTVFNGVFGADVSFGGTSLIIIVGVILETIKQIESKMQVRFYKGFLNN